MGGSNLDIQVSDEKVDNLLLTNHLESLEPTDSVIFQDHGDLQAIPGILTDQS